MIFSRGVTVVEGGAVEVRIRRHLAGVPENWDRGLRSPLIVLLGDLVVLRVVTVEEEVVGVTVELVEREARNSSMTS